MNGAFLDQLGSLLLNEGFFVLFPILGVGAFFFPKLLGGAKPEPADLNIAIALWKKRALIAALTGAAIWISFVLEALDWPRAAAIVRGSAVLLYFAFQGHLFEKPGGPAVSRPLLPLRRDPVGDGSLFSRPVAGLSTRQCAPHVHRRFHDHSFTVSTRVILGHSGHAHLFQKRLRFSNRRAGPPGHRDGGASRRGFFPTGTKQSSCLCGIALGDRGSSLGVGADAEVTYR